MPREDRDVLSPRAFFVTLSLPFCPLEPLFFVAPSVSEGSPPLGRHPERSEGSLATHVPREDRNVLSPQAPARGAQCSLLSPRGASRGVSLGLPRYRSAGQAWLSPRALFFSVTPSPFLSPRGVSRGVSNCQRGDFSLRSK